MTHIFPKRTNLLYRTLSGFTAFAFLFNVVLLPVPGLAQTIPQTLLNLPAPGTMVSLSAGFTPALVRGMTIHPDNPLQFDFFVSQGDTRLEGEALKAESKKLIKYFLASLTVPEEELWVNLSPYEKDRIIPQGFGETEMGRDLLAQDYILKQLTASLMYPEEELGKKFWDKVYRQARAKYGTAEIPVDTFNKVWIVPEKAVVYEHGDSVFVVESRLKVMLEQDYVAMNSIVGNADLRSVQEQSGVPTEIIREIIIPALEKEVNEGKSFASLRQIYNSSILAVWYKQKFTVGTGRDLSLLGQVYVNQNKTKGIDVEDKTVKEKIYNQYLEAFKKGVYNYIKEDYDPATHSTIPRKYFSGGTNLTSSPVLVKISKETWGEYPLEIQKRILEAMSKKVLEVRWVGVENADDKTIAQAGSQRPEAPKKPLKSSSSPVEDMVRIISWIAGEIRSQELAPAEEREIRDGRFTTIFTSNDAVQWGLTSDQAFTLLHKLGVTTVVEQTDWDRGIWRIGLPDKNGLIQQVQSQVTELEKYRETVVSAWNKSNGETDLYSQRFQSARIEDMKRLDIEISQLNNKIDELRNQKTSSSPVLSAKTRENSVTGAMARIFEKSQKEMEWMAGIFSEVTRVPLQKIQEEITNEIYGPIYQALNEIADYAQRGDINPAGVRLRLSSHDPEITAQPAMGRVPRVLYLAMKGDPWQLGHLFIILESIAKYKLDKVIVGIDNSDPIRKPGLSSLTIREAITREMLNSLGDVIEYTPIAKEEEKLFAADGETMIFYLMSLNENQAIDWYYLAGSDHRYWDIKKKHPETGKEITLPDTAHKLFNFMNQGLDGFQKGGKHTVSLILSQRNGEPVTDEELSLLKDRSGLREVGKIVQLMDTSSTRVRKNGHFWTVPFSAYQYAKAFEMWGVETEEIKREQQELALRLKFYVVAKLRGWLEQEDPEERIKQDLQKATGLGMNEFDSFLMKQFAGTDEQQLSGQDKQWLQGIRNLVFQRGEEIVKSAASSPAAAVDEIARREVPGILREMNEVYGLTRSEAARLTGNPFAQIGFDGDANRMGWTLQYLNWILQNPAALEQTLSDARHIRENYENVIFIGMGGSGLGVEVIKSTFGTEKGPQIFSLRTTDPAVVAELTKQLAESSGGDLKAALRKTKIEVISKTFTTQEVLENRQYFEGLYRDLGIENVSSHFTLVTDPGSKLDIKAAQDAGYEVRYIQLNKGTDIGGRNTTFTNINLLPLAILAPERVMPFLQEAREMNQKSGVQEDTFAVLGIYLHYMATQYAQRKDKVTFLVPEELRALPMWSEQLIEESLGKDGKGITVVYGEDLTAQRLQNPRFTKDRVFLRFNLGGKVTRPDLADVLFGREDVFDINVESIDQIGGLMLGLQRTVAIIAQRWNTNFVNQPGVQGYKTATDEEMAKLKLKPGKRVEISSNWEYGTFDKLKIYYTPFIEAGIITKEELEREAAGLGSDLKDGAAVYAALIHIARETGKFELAEIASYGHMNPAVWNVMQKARTDIFTDRLAMASKLGEGPDRNHSFHQSVEQGPDYHLSTYLMPLETTQPQIRKYDENPLRAQTLGTVKSLIKAGRKAVLISIDGKIADSEAVLGRFFERVDDLLAASSPVLHEDLSIREWSINGKSAGQILDKIVQGYDVRGFDGYGDSKKYPKQIDETLLQWLGRGLGTTEFYSDVHNAAVSLKPGDSFVIAGDNGPSTEWFKENLSKGLRDTGVHVIDLGTVVSGQLYKAIKHLGAQGGLYVTRSHVEVGTNGFKPVIGGITLYGDMLQAMKNQILDAKYRKAPAPVTLNDVSKVNTTAANIEELRAQTTQWYLDSLKEEFKDLKGVLDRLPMKIAVNLSGGAAANIKYKEFFEEMLGEHLVKVFRDESDPWNENGGLADPSRGDETALAHPKADIIKYSKDNPETIVINFDLDVDRIGLVWGEELYLGDRMFYPVIEYMMTIDKYKDINKTLPVWVDSRMLREVRQLAEYFGGFFKKHAKGHSWVKATMDIMFKKLAQDGGYRDVQSFLDAHPGFKMTSAEYSLHMFLSNEKGESFDDAFRFSLFWLEVFSKVKEKHQKPQWSIADYIQHLVEQGAIKLSEQLKEQRVPITAEAKKEVMLRMRDHVRQYFSGRNDFRFQEKWRKAEISHKPYSLQDIDGVFDFSTPSGDVFWGWSETSPKDAYGVQSDSETKTRKLTEAVLALFIHSRNEVNPNLPLIDPLETQQTMHMFEVLDVDSRAVVEFGSSLKDLVKDEKATAFALRDKVTNDPSMQETAGKLDIDLSKLTEKQAIIDAIKKIFSAQMSKELEQKILAKHATVESAIEVFAASSPVSEPPHEVGMVNLKEGSPYRNIRMTMLSGRDLTLRKEVIYKDGTFKTDFLRKFEYKISWGPDEFGSLTYLSSDDGFIDVHELSISEKYVQNGIGFTVLTWLAHQAIENGQTLRRRTRDLGELQMSQEVMTNITVGTFRTSFVPLIDPTKPIMEDTNVQQIWNADKYVEVHGTPNPRLPVMPPVSLPVSFPKLTIDDIQEFEGKNFMARVDFNVPMTNGTITDDTRIRASLPLIKKIVAKGGKVILTAHFGRPQERKAEIIAVKKEQGIPASKAHDLAVEQMQKELTLAPVAKRLKELLAADDIKAYFNPDYRTPGQEEAAAFIANVMKNGEVLLLENMRFNDEEEILVNAESKLKEARTEADKLRAENEVDQAREAHRRFSEMLFQGVDVFALDGFAVAHRGHASVVGAPQNIPRVAGPLLKDEIVALQQIRHNLHLAIMGGLKVSDKIKVLKRILSMDTVQFVLIGGAMANAFLKAKGYHMGSSKGTSPDQVDIARELFGNPKIVIPVDGVIASRFDDKAEHRVITFAEEDVPAGWMVVEIGPKTIAMYVQKIASVPADASIFWNGPMGVYDKLPSFAADGTREVAEATARSQAFTMVGGGDSVDAVNTFGLSGYGYVLTGGGAALKALELEEGRELAGIAALSSASSPVGDQGPGARVQGTEFTSGEIRDTNNAPGGIDLNPALLDLQIRRDANFVPLPLPQQPIGTMRIDGFTPVIINITPVSNLPMLLGIADDELPADAADSARSAPMTLGFAIKEN